MIHRAGFEPATSRVIGEVTEIFTTDRDGVGGEGAMLLLPLRANRLSACGIRTCSALSCLHHEVTDIFTTARPMLSRRPLMGTLGNGRYRLSVTATQRLSLRREAVPGRVQTFSEAASRCVCQRRDSNPLYRGGSIRHLHHQRRLSRDRRGKPSYEISIAALSTRRQLRTLRVRSAIGVRLVASFPPAGPAHLGTRLSSASPEIRVSRSGPLPGCSNGPHGGQQKTLRSGRLGRVREKRTVDLAFRQDRSHEPGMRSRIAWSYSICGQFFRSGAA